MSSNSKEIPGDLSRKGAKVLLKAQTTPPIMTSAERVLAVQTYRAKPDERNDPHSNPVSPGRHLDVDAVLARSLPKVAGE